MGNGNKFSLAFVLMLLFCFSSAKAQSGQNVSGVVTEAGTGETLPGVNIKVKGTTTGTSTDAKGRFELEVPSLQDTLVFSFIGYSTQEVQISGRTEINITLQESTNKLSEMVVTALGIKREERSLGYSVGRVTGDELTGANNENVLNSLAGKVPGVSISATGDVGSSVSTVIRGATSLNGDNQPLFVVDGVPINNSLNNVTDFGSRNVVDYGNAVSDLNPEDIADVSILKGPSAAALYGSRAANGVVLITTKTGKKNSGLGISVNSSTVFDMPYKFLPVNTSRFASGERPYTPDNHPGKVLSIDAGSSAWVGPELDKGYKAVQWNSPLDANGDPMPIPLVSYPDNSSNFFQTGITSTNGVAISNGTDDLSYRISYSNMSHRGVIPNSDLYKNSLNFSSSYNLTKNLVFSTNINLLESKSNNRPAGDRGANPLSALAYLNPSINIMDLRNYWMPGQEGIQQRSYASGQDNPWFLTYEAIHKFDRKRVFGNLQAMWQITPEFSIRGRYELDTKSEQREAHVAKSYSRAPNGIYGLEKLSNYEGNFNLLSTYEKTFNDFDINASVGGNIRYHKDTNFMNGTNSGGLVVPGLYNIGNVLPSSLIYSNYLSEKEVYSAFGKASLGYKQMIYLDLTARNDWSSTLPVTNRSYFYPSASLSILLNQIFHMSPAVSEFKLRGGWAQVGKDTGPYRISPVVNNAGAWGDQTRLSIPNTLLNLQLKPEIATSYEFGTDLAFFNNRLRFQGTYYLSDNKNQILGINIPSSSGYNSKLINGGLVRSQGVEFLMGITPTPASSDWRWDLNVNFSRNRTVVKKLTEGIDHYTFWQDAKGGAWTYLGGTIGDIYARQMVTVQDKNSPYYGYPILGNSGSWQDYGSGQSEAVKIGNFNPDFTMGLQTSVSYKAFTFSASVDWRQGGDFVSQTYRYTESDLHSERFLDNTIKYSGPQEDLPQYLKDHADEYVKNGIHIVGGPTKALGGFKHTEGGITLNDGVFNPGVIEVTDDEGNFVGYQENLGGPGTQYIRYQDNYPWSFTQASLFDASFIKLREISFRYALPDRLTRSIGLQGASVSLYSRNIILWTKAKIGIDPEHAFQPTGGGNGNGVNFEQGIERYNVQPWQIPIGIKLSANL